MRQGKCHNRQYNKIQLLEHIQFCYVDDPQQTCGVNLDVLKQELDRQNTEIVKIHQRLDLQLDILGKNVQNTANIDSFGDFMKENEKWKSRSEPTNHLEHLETFQDLGSLPKITTTAELEAFEVNLQDQTYSDRFFRFLKSKYNFKSIRNGKTLFTMIILQLIDPELFAPYS